MRHLFLAAVAAIALFPFAAGAAELHCDRSDSISTPSPEGGWVANVQEEVCETPSGSAAGGITVVLHSAQDSATMKRVFIVPVPRSREDWPRVSWLSESQLQIRIPNLTEATDPEPEFAGVRITLVRCGDNPEHRAQLAAYREAVLQWQKDVGAWVQKRKQDEQAAGPRPPRPQEPRLPGGRCRD